LIILIKKMNKSTFTQGTIYITISTIVFVASSYLINIILGRLLGPAAYGIYGVVIALMTAINLTQTSGLPLAVAKFIADNEKSSDSVLKSALTLQFISTIIASVVFFVFARTLAAVLNDLDLVPYIQMSAAVFPLYGIYSIYTNYYNGLHDFKTQALMTIVYSVAKFLLVLVLVYFLHVYGAILGFVLSPLIVLLFWFKIPNIKTKSFSYRKLISFSLPLIGLAIFSTLLQSIDLLFIKSILTSDKATGYYTASQNISRIPFYAITALASVLFPSIAKSVSHKLEEQTKKLIVGSIRFTLIILLPTVLIISATSAQVMELFYSPSYLPGALALSILVIGGGFFTLFTILSTIISSAGFPYKVFWLSATGVFLSSIFCYFLIPKFGIEGAAFATTLATITITIWSALVVYNKFKVLIQIKNLLRILFASLIIYFLAFIIIVPLYLLPFYYILLYGAYILILIYTKEINTNDILLVKTLMPTWLRRKFYNE
jgi:stage V sporulation protein B